jgi:hypothetical protein
LILQQKRYIGQYDPEGERKKRNQEEKEKAALPNKNKPRRGRKETKDATYKTAAI